MIQKTLDQISPRAFLAGVFGLSALPILLIASFPSWFDIVLNRDSYLVFHNIAEFFSIMVSLSIFGVGWYTHDQTEDQRALFLSTAFLVIGLMDFMHTMSNAAMPAFITPNSTNKSTQFWIAVRLFSASAFLASAFIYSDKPIRLLSKKILLTTSLAVSGLVLTGIIFYPAAVPATFIEGAGLTPFKKISEYLITVLMLAAAIAYWRRMTRTRDSLLVYYIASFILCMFSELVFANYTRTFDTYNVLGHIYKVAAFYLIYRGIFAASVKAPYVNLLDTHEKLRKETISRNELEKEIQERKRTEEELRQAYARLRIFFDHRIGGIGIVIANAQGDILQANDYYLNILGCTRDELLSGKVRWREMTPPEWLPADEKALAQLRLSGVCDAYEKEYVRRDDSRRPVLITDAMMPGERGEILAFVLDITERKKAEAEVLKLSEDMAARNLELESVNKELESFIYSVSHDLRAPIRTMAGFAKIIVEDYTDKLDVQGKNYLSRIQAGSEKMSRLIEDLLNLSRITRQEMDRIETDLSSKASIAIAELREAGPDRNVVVEIQPGLKASADPRLIEVVMSNLLGNAWKFTSKTEKARIKFGAVNSLLQISDCGLQNETTAEQVTQGKMVYYVRDNGAGFDPLYADKMFWPFHRLHTEQEFEGTGIGLTIVERIIRRHGGSVWSEGETGKGATMFFTLG